MEPTRSCAYAAFKHVNPLRVIFMILPVEVRTTLDLKLLVSGAISRRWTKCHASEMALDVQKHSAPRIQIFDVRRLVSFLIP